MTPESTRYLKLLERRLELLGLLAQTLAQSRHDFIAMNLSGIERRVAEQEQLCAQIRSLDAEIARMQSRCAENAGSRPAAGTLALPGSPDGDVQQDDRIRAMLGRVGLAQAELKKINDAHQAMLRRSKRTVQILLNLFSSFAPTYSAPVPSRATYEERA